MEKNKILNFLHLNSVGLAKVTDLSQVILQTDAHIVAGMVE